MTKFVAKRVLFRNGERHSVLSRPGGLPVHEATLYLARYRKRGRAANTIHAVCMTLVVLYRELDTAGIDLLQRLRQGQFLTGQELNRLVDAAQYWLADLSDEDADERGSSNVIDIKRIRIRRKSAVEETKSVSVVTQATRLRYMADYLGFLATYMGAALSSPLRKELAFESDRALEALRAQIPPVSKRAKLGAREGLSKEDQDRLLKVIDPDSPANPWERGFVRQRDASWRTARLTDSRP
jgi:hypothetical protein